MGKRSDRLKSDDKTKKVKLAGGGEVTKRKHKHKEKHKKKHKKEKRRKKEARQSGGAGSDADSSSGDRLLMDRAKALAPMTKEEWEKQQSVVRRVFDEETGRTRLVKGDGEILEEIVSKKEHIRINKTATKNDGNFFQKNLVSKLK